MDLSNYSGISVFTLELAALLWCEADEITKENRACVQAWFDELVSAVKNDELQIEVVGRRFSSSWMGYEGRLEINWKRSKVTRDDLKSWAKTNGHKPRFLFLEMAPDEQTTVPDPA